jgi:ankyrin repeat protein
MKKLLLFLSIINIYPLFGMKLTKQNDLTIALSIEHFSKSSPITLPQIYFYFSQELLSDIAGYILALLMRNDIHRINKPILFHPPIPEIVRGIHAQLNTYGYLFMVEKLSRNLFCKQNISICAIKNSNSATLLHEAARLGYTKDVKLYLQVAGKDKIKLLKTQTIFGGSTALHEACLRNNIDLIKILLDAAGDDAQELIHLQNNEKETALEIGSVEAQAIMRQYLKNNR